MCHFTKLDNQKRELASRTKTQRRNEKCKTLEVKFELDGSGIVHKVDDHGNVYEALDSQPEKAG